MTFKYKKELTLIGVTALLCLSIFAYIKVAFFNDKKIDEPIKNVIKCLVDDYVKTKRELSKEDIVAITTEEALKQIEEVLK